MSDNIAKFSYNISNTANKIQLVYTLEINQAIVAPEDYETLKTFFKEIITKQTEKIVLKKV